MATLFRSPDRATLPDIAPPLKTHAPGRGPRRRRPPTNRPPGNFSAMTPRPGIPRAPDDHHALRLWLRMLTCCNLIEGEIRSRLRNDSTPPCRAST